LVVVHIIDNLHAGKSTVSWKTGAGADGKTKLAGKHALLGTIGWPIDMAIVIPWNKRLSDVEVRAA
jgi:hypothetical protein